MRTILTIKNQYDNIIRKLEWNKAVAKNFIKSIKKPLVVESKDNIPQWKIATSLGDKRCTENMGVTDVLILDYDDKDFTIEEFERQFSEFYYILHTSYSYDGVKQKFRVFLFLDKEYEINRLFYKCSNKTFSTYHLLTNYFNHADVASFVKAQFFKVPAVKTKDSPYYYKLNNGRLFDPVKEIGFEFKMCYDYCLEKQEEYLRKKEKEYEKYRKKFGSADLTKAKKYIEEKIESTAEGGRHNVIFGLATWWKHIGGTFTEFSSCMPSWADRDYHKQIQHLRQEWDRLR